MNPTAFRATAINVAGNTVLFALKLVAGLLSGSIALISDAINSLNDIAASIATFICVKISDKQADEGHPFGHSRAEPVAGIIIAVLAGILGFEIIRASIERLFFDEAVVEVGAFALFVPIFTMAAKGGMSYYFRYAGKKINSPALIATSVDSFMDVAIAFAALVGIAGAYAGYPILDPIAGLVISLWIIYAGYRIGMDNIAYLMGSAPPPALMEQIRGVALSITGVKAIRGARAHYVGNFIHVELIVVVDKDLSTFDSHAIGESVAHRVESISAIDKAFVHIDPE